LVVSIAEVIMKTRHERLQTPINQPSFRWRRHSTAPVAADSRSVDVGKQVYIVRVLDGRGQRWTAIWAQWPSRWKLCEKASHRTNKLKKM